MAAKKLSEITVGTPSNGDRVVGVTASNQDVLFDVSQIGGTASLNPAPSNLSFWVATTGSDSNPGTLAQPFATVQHAIDVAESFDWLNSFFPTINIEPGTYGVGVQGTNEAGNLHNIDFQFGVIQSTGGPAVTFIGNPAAPSSFEVSGPEALWTIGGFTSIAQQVSFFVTNFASLQIIHAGGLGDVGLNGGQTFLIAQLYANVLIFKAHITINGDIPGWLEADRYCSISNVQSTIVWPATTVMSGDYFHLEDFSVIDERANTVTNFGGITGGGLTQLVGTVLLTNGGNLGDVGGTAGLKSATASDAFFNAFSFIGGYYANKVSGAPAAGNLSSGAASFFKDITQAAGLGVTASYNDAGTLVSVTLGGFSGTITTAKLTAGGTNGSMTFTNGALTAQVAAT